MTDRRRAEQIRLANVVQMYRDYDPEHRTFTRVKRETDGRGNLIIVGKPAQYHWSLLGYGQS